MNKYFEGSIYINFYLDVLAGVVGQSIAQVVYPCARIQWSFIISISITLTGGIFLLCLQQEYCKSNWIAPFVPEKSPYPEGSPQENTYYMGYAIPAVVFYTKIGVNFSFQNAYMASFKENIVFPFYRRATAIGICNFVARGLTVLSTLAAEAPNPIPMSLLIGSTAIALIDVIFLPTYGEQEEFYERERKLLDETVKEEKEEDE